MSAPDSRVDAVAKMLHQDFRDYPDSSYGPVESDWTHWAERIVATLPQPETLAWTVWVIPYWEQKPYFSGTFSTRDMAEAHARATPNVECRVVRVVAE